MLERLNEDEFGVDDDSRRFAIDLRLPLTRTTFPKCQFQEKHYRESFGFSYVKQRCRIELRIELGYGTLWLLCGKQDNSERKSS